MAGVEEEEEENMEESENKGPEKISKYHRVVLVPRHVSTRKIR